MSSTYISKRPVVPPGRSVVRSLNKPHPRITPQRTAVSYDPANTSGHGHDVSADQINQYNDIVKEDVSLTLRSLPPVKLSFKNSKTKFMKSPRDDENSSRILRPHLTLKTHSPGHHVFTEGISRNSEIPHASFALQSLKVPYSNLPDNIRIYKEKNRFAFGVKTNREDVVTPYKLTPKPKSVQVVNIQSHGPHNKLKGIQLDVKGVKHISESTKKEPDKSKDIKEIKSDIKEIKSNVIRLDPILAGSESSYGTGTVKEGSHDMSVELLAPANSFFMTENTKLSMNKEDTSLKPPVRERQLSVVSIGDDVTATLTENQKRKTRQLYPIYDHKTRVKETYKKMKFNSNLTELLPSRRPKPLPETFTYKISTRSFGYGGEDLATNVKPIRNNLYDRELSTDRSGRIYDDMTDADRRMREYFEPKLQKYYSRYPRRGQNRPQSGDSDVSSTDMSQLPANPPPSEISHIHSEDMVMTYNEHKPDMITLHEERTQTAEMAALKGRVDLPKSAVKEKAENDSTKNNDNKMDESITKLDVQVEKNVINDTSGETAMTDRSENKTINNDNETIATDTDILMDKVIDNAYKMQEPSDEPSESVTDRYAPIAETSKENTQISIGITLPAIETDDKPAIDNQRAGDMEGLTSIPSILTDSQKSITSRKVQKSNPNKTFLPVPTVSLDKLSHHPLLPNIKDRTSLSRSLQNLTVGEQFIDGNDQEIESDSTDPDKLSLRINFKTSIPVTQLRLFSSSTSASVQAPSLNITDEFGEDHRLVYENFYMQDKEEERESNKSLEKKLVTSSNIAFISPLKFEARAKRQ